MSVFLWRLRSGLRMNNIQGMVRKTVVLEAYVQTSYDTYSHIFRTVEIEIPDDGNDWHVSGEMEDDEE